MKCTQQKKCLKQGIQQIKCLIQYSTADDTMSHTRYTTKQWLNKYIRQQMTHIGRLIFCSNVQNYS